MKIAIISYYFNDHHAEGIVTAKLARALAEAGHSVTVFGNIVGTQSILGKNKTNLVTLKIESNFPNWWKFLENIVPLNYLGEKFLAIPSLITYSSPSDYGWIINVKKAVLNEHQKEPFDIIHSRLNPHSSHQVALSIKKKYPKIPWCAYFSDPWPPHRLPAPHQNSSGTLSKWRSDMLMNAFIKYSNSYIFPSNYMRDYILDNPKLKNKSFIAPHLSSYWESPKAPTYRDKIIFRHAGILNKNRTPGILFEGIRKFLKRNPSAREYLKFEFLGRNYAGPGSSPMKVPIDLKNIVSFIDQKDLSGTWKWISTADILLLLEFQFSKGIFFYAKLSDYLHANRPIFALSPKTGVIADLFKNGGGIITNPNNSEDIAKSLSKVISLWKSNDLSIIAHDASLSLSVQPKKVIPIYEEAFKFAIGKN